jgi:hypothetical protein
MRASDRAIITIGSMFEWFEVFLYNYWAPLMSENFFDLSAIGLISSTLTSNPVDSPRKIDAPSGLLDEIKPMANKGAVIWVHQKT